MSELDDPVVQVIPWVLEGCAPISVEISRSGRIFVNGERVETIEETRVFFRARKTQNKPENLGC
jgi:hypothetical protein